MPTMMACFCKVCGEQMADIEVSDHAAREIRKLPLSRPLKMVCATCEARLCLKPAVPNG